MKANEATITNANSCLFGIMKKLVVSFPVLITRHAALLKLYIQRWTHIKLYSLYNLIILVHPW